MDTICSGIGKVIAGEGIDINDHTISCEDASLSNKGIASFSTDNFNVSSGAVTIKNSGVLDEELAGSSQMINANNSVSLGERLRSIRCF